MSDNINMENVVVIFRTFEELQRDQDLILADFEKQWQDAWDAFEVARDALRAEDEGGTLAKVIATPFFAARTLAALTKFDPSLRAEIDELSSQFAKVAAEHHRLTKQHEVLQNLESARKAAIEKRDGRLYGFGKLARRSQRFASAHERKNYGPGGASLPPAS
jgi:hypothetical protein